MGTISKIKKELGDIHHDLLFEKMRVEVLLYASDRCRDEFDEGLAALIGDHWGRLKDLCDRVENVCMSIPTEQAEV